MIYVTLSVPRLFGVPCDRVNMAIVTQIKAMGSYKVRNLNRNLVSHGCGCFGDCHVTIINTDLQNALFVVLIQLGPVTPALIQANHTSAVGQIEGVNFTMIGTSMALGCHVEVSQMLLHPRH